MKTFTRRELLIGSGAVVGATSMPGQAMQAVLTPMASEGPFYPTASMRMSDVDNDLVKVDGQVKEAGGEIIHLKGRVSSKNGEALNNHRIEIWQCDINGRYLHPRDGRQITYDKGFQGFGHDLTDAEGNYHFRTIKPSRYPGRAPHIHVKISAGQRELLTTQFYIADHPDNQADFLFRRMTTEQARSVSMAFDRLDKALETRIDVII